MSSANLRLVAGGLTLIVAVLVGLVTGFAGSSAGCVSEQAPGSPTDQPGNEQQGPGPQPSTAPSGGGFDNEGPSFGTGGGAGQVLTVAAPADRCGKAFSVRSAVTGFGGALLAGAIAGGMLLYAAQRRRPGPPGPVAPVSVTPASPAMVGAGVPTGPPSVPRQGAAQLQPAPAAVAAPAAPAKDGRANGERAALIQTCIYVRDRATSQAIADHLGRVLAEVGVATVAPKGRFDPTKHEAGGSASTQDESLDGTIAGVELPGYTDRGTVLRAPVVTVYRRSAR